MSSFPTFPVAVCAYIVDIIMHYDNTPFRIYTDTDKDDLE